MVASIESSQAVGGGNGGGNRSTPPCAKTTDLRSILPQIPLRFLRIEAIWDLAEVHDGQGRARGQKPAFTEDLYAPVLIKGDSALSNTHFHMQNMQKSTSALFS